MAERELTGIQYDDGDEHETVVEQLQHEAEGGSAEAMNRLAQLYIDGDEVPQDEEEAAEWFYQSASLGDTHGLLMLGSMYLEGTGVSQNMDLARDNLEKAAAQGSEEARKLLNRMDAELSEAQKRAESSAAEHREAEPAAGRAAVPDTWGEQEMSREEMINRLRGAAAMLTKKEELEQKERMVVVPAAGQSGKTRKKLPGKRWIIAFILAGIVIMNMWGHLFEIADYNVAALWKMMKDIPFFVSDGLTGAEVTLLGIMFVPPVVCVVSVIGWIHALRQRGKEAEKETKRLKEAQDQANAQKKLLKDNISLAAKSAQDTLSFLPQRYHSVAPCEALARLFEDGRADSLKEALNIYSMEYAGGGTSQKRKVSRRGL